MIADIQGLQQMLLTFCNCFWQRIVTLLLTGTLSACHFLSWWCTSRADRRQPCTPPCINTFCVGGLNTSLWSNANIKKQWSVELTFEESNMGLQAFFDMMNEDLLHICHDPIIHRSFFVDLSSVQGLAQSHQTRLCSCGMP